METRLGWRVWFPDEILNQINAIILSRESLTPRECSLLIALGAGFGLEREVRELLDKVPECVLGNFVYLPAVDEVEL